MPARRSPKDLVLTTTAFEAAANAGCSMRVELSLENILFYKDYAFGGLVMEKDYYDRQLQAGQRKCGRSDVLIDKMGILTFLGRVATDDSNILFRSIRSHNGVAPTLENAYRMDEIVVSAVLNNYALRLLQFLFDILPVTQKEGFDADIKNGFVAPLEKGYDDQLLVPSKYIRNNAGCRAAMEKLVGFGLVQIFPIGWDELTQNPRRGRQAIGYAITEPGRRFFIDFVATYHPKIQAMLKHGHITLPGPARDIPDEGERHAHSQWKAAMETVKDNGVSQDKRDKFRSMGLTSEIPDYTHVGPPMYSNEWYEQMSPGNFAEPDPNDPAQEGYRRALEMTRRNREERERAIAAGEKPAEPIENPLEVAEPYGAIGNDDIDPETGDNLRELFGG